MLKVLGEAQNSNPLSVIIPLSTLPDQYLRSLNFALQSSQKNTDFISTYMSELYKNAISFLFK